MIKEDYVSTEIANLLKEKGMDKSCFKHYVQKNNNDGTSEAVTVCTLQMAMRWLRDVHYLFIDIDQLTGNMWTWSVWFMDNPDQKMGESLQSIATYEEACESSIKFCLENLI